MNDQQIVQFLSTLAEAKIKQLSEDQSLNCQKIKDDFDMGFLTDNEAFHQMLGIILFVGDEQTEVEPQAPNGYSEDEYDGSFGMPE